MRGGGSGHSCTIKRLPGVRWRRAATEQSARVSSGALYRTNRCNKVRRWHTTGTEYPCRCYLHIFLLSYTPYKSVLLRLEG
jgi:hypothetical protein